MLEHRAYVICGLFQIPFFPCPLPSSYFGPDSFPKPIIALTTKQNASEKRRNFEKEEHKKERKL